MENKRNSVEFNFQFFHLEGTDIHFVQKVDQVDL